MKKNLSPRLVFFHQMLVLLVFGIYISISSCNNSGTKKEESKDSITVSPDTTSKTGVIKPLSERDDCYTLTKQDLESWTTDPDWSDSGKPDSYIQYLLLYPELANETTTLTIYACPVVQGNARLAEIKVLAVRTLNPPCESVNGAEIRANIYDDFAAQFKNLRKEKFDRVRFKPVPYMDGTTLTMNFDVESVNPVTGGETVVQRSATKPSPPAAPLLYEVKEYIKSNFHNK